ncbi:MAG: hypothetical protein RDV41_03265, partial [Planctomycetota bacterium]|nr:hypothetical protein [Planctomycetota bacterium]
DRVAGVQSARLGNFQLGGAARTPVGTGVLPFAPASDKEPIRASADRERGIRYYPKILWFRLLNNLMTLVWIGAIAAGVVIIAVTFPALRRWLSPPPKVEAPVTDRSAEKLGQLRRFEEENAKTVSFEEIGGRYRDFIHEYSGTQAAKKASFRLEELQSMEREAEQKFEETRAKGRLLGTADALDEAFVLWEQYIEFVEGIPG